MGYKRKNYGLREVMKYEKHGLKKVELYMRIILLNIVDRQKIWRDTFRSL